MNVCLNSTRAFHDQDSHLPSSDPRLFDVVRGMRVPLDSIPPSGRVSDRDRYCSFKDTPTLGYKGRGDYASGWHYYVTRNQSLPFNPVIFGEGSQGQFQQFVDPMDATKTEMRVGPRDQVHGDQYGLNDMQDQATHRFYLQSRLQSRLDERKFGPLFVQQELKKGVGGQLKTVHSLAN